MFGEEGFLSCAGCCLADREEISRGLPRVGGTSPLGWTHTPFMEKWIAALVEQLQNGHRRVGPAWGTNLGEFYTRRQPAKRSVIAVFSFEGDRTTNERVYFEAASLLPQVGSDELLAMVSEAT